MRTACRVGDEVKCEIKPADNVPREMAANIRDLGKRGLLYFVSEEPGLAVAADDNFSGPEEF
jgi:hypothetical protein